MYFLFFISDFLFSFFLVNISNFLDSYIYRVRKLNKFWVKYILAPHPTTISSDGPPNYQCLDSGPLNYHFLIFWPHPSIYAVNSKQKFENTPPIL
jgi:hypothetical protein